MSDRVSNPTEPLPAIASLLPHKRHMVLVDELIECVDGRAVASVDLRRRSVFHNVAGEVPTYVGLEYLLQTVSAMVGYRRWLDGESPLVGLVMGCRELKCHSVYFPNNALLQITVDSVLSKDMLGVFDGRVCANDQCYCEGRVKAIQPQTQEQLQELLAHKR